ncbi:putative queuine tRNA-ribosyltransferase [Podospora fimiseda]|uniref:Queuine tRNA-ribosyltransferase accessory subunit 2 n=1 Tax=Podospora fimiseda TaxID=252190 RepID=A0AAN7BSJ0_9PEZI|nr:putative queuine tRNA-ribosyltransferase [Podospora fimiseda]
MTVDVDIEEPGSSTAMRFEVLKTALKDAAAAARPGRLSFPTRRPIETPNFMGVTSRGCLPHLTPDNVTKYIQASGAYMSLEDFIEKPQQHSSRVPPIYSTPTSSKHPTPLHSFTGMPSFITTILGARRIPAVPSPMGNTNKSISVFTNTGFQPLTTSDYLSAVNTLKPDITIPLSDLTNSNITPNSKRALRMAERTEDWIVDWFNSSSSSSTATFAPVLPISYPMQWEYLTRLSEDYVDNSQLSGLAIYDPSLLPDLPSPLLSLPRLSLSPPTTPHQILSHISLGIDLFTLPFINTISDAGIALNFTFPAPLPSSPSRLLPLGTDISNPSFSKSVTPLSENCKCYSCTTHSKAYVQHLLAAREMLGWTLLQIHNHHVLSEFFSGVRHLLQNGPDEDFEKARNDFLRAYEPDFPAGHAEKPRARGYQYKSVGGGEPKKNKPAWGKLGPDADGNVEGVETPVVPEGKEVEEKGFAEEVKE